MHQSAAFIQAKNAHQINPLKKLIPLAYPSSYTLPTYWAFEDPWHTATRILQAVNAACQTSGYGTHTISQSALYNAIENDNGNGALIW